MSENELDLFTRGLGAGPGEVKKKRGRPRGARNKASQDLGRWFTAMTGQTPGQQLLALAAVTPRDRRLAKEWAARQKNVMLQGDGSGVDLRAFDPTALALVWKAANFAALNRIGLAEAWAMMFKAHDILMPYVHSKQPAVQPVEADKRPVIMSAPLGQLSNANPSQVSDLQREISFLPLPVTQVASHKGEKPE